MRVGLDTAIPPRPCALLLGLVYFQLFLPLLFCCLLCCSPFPARLLCSGNATWERKLLRADLQDLPGRSHGGCVACCPPCGWRALAEPWGPWQWVAS